VVIFGHHPVGSLTFPNPDETAPACTAADSVAGPPDTLPPHDHDTPPHDVNPGCDLDPRPSAPIHLGTTNAGGESFVSLLDRFPNVIAYVAGHTHRHNLDVFERTSEDSAWWSIETSAVVDWPTQSRLIEVMDNRDDTLSIFGTVIDHASDATAPPDGSAAGFDANQLASIGRTLSYNDPQGGPPGGEGAEPGDRNAELLLFDPREADLSLTKVDAPDPVDVGDPLTYTLTVTNEDPLGDVSGANGVVVTDDLPATVDFVSATPSGGGTCNDPDPGEDLVCELGDLPTGGTGTVTVVVTPQVAGQITNSATVSSIFNDPVAGNDTVQQDTTVNPAAGSADLQVTKTDSPDPVTAGEQLTYTVSARNNGPDPAFAAFTDQLPPGVVFVSASAPGGCELDLGTVTCLLGTLANGATASGTVVVRPQLPGTLFNQASVLSSLADPAAGNNTEGESTQVNPRAAGSAPTGSCRGRPATIVGTGAGETITGTAGPDVIAAGDGGDTVLARKGRDVVCGEAGDDRLFGGKGRDLLIGGAGNDRLGGGKGRDRARGGAGKDRCTSARHKGCQGRKPKPRP
jgi:uncharacterized repeat protein (TIGR01451 family)